MPQRTLVLACPAARAEELARRLEAAGARLEGAPHARFRARGTGFIATLYSSGKLVVQGDRPETFVEQFLGEAGEALVARESARPALASSRFECIALVGSDECGKGDYFGPLVVAAVRLAAGQAAELRRGGIVDSKLVSDANVARLGPALRSRFEHAIEALEPPAYNALHARVRNLNPMLAELHSRALRRVVRPKDCVLIDQFAPEALMRRTLADLDIELVQMPRAEREMAVAAASILAREAFLTRLAELSEEHAIDLHKGAGSPTDRAARQFVELHGFAKLGLVAKLHFKNTNKLPPERSGTQTR
jgi:ribonuclease HIII